MEYNIKTLQDMLNVVKPESLDNFLQDLRQVFETYYIIKAYGCTIVQFKWIDDGQHEMKVNVFEIITIFKLLI
jgi:hypothetical protein